MTKEGITIWFTSGWVFVALAMLAVYEVHDNWKDIHRWWAVVLVIYLFAPLLINLTLSLAVK